jgi:hypothetical protein
MEAISKIGLRLSRARIRRLGNALNVLRPAYPHFSPLDFLNGNTLIVL